MKAGCMEQESGPAPTDNLPEAGLVAALKWGRAGKEQAQLKHKLKDLPGLLRQGLNFRRRSAGAALSAAKSDSILERSRKKIYSENVFCAGRALRDTFLSQASHLMKDLTSSAPRRKICAGIEMVDWLLESCSFLQSRVKAAGVWQILLEMGVLSSAADRQQLCFQDTNTLFQFSAEGCDHLVCTFGKQEEWQKGVQLLLQLAPQVPSRPSACSLPALEVVEDKAEVSEEVLQIQAFARLAAAVQKELAAVLALKAGKSVTEPEERSKCGQAELQSSEDTTKESMVTSENCCSPSSGTTMEPVKKMAGIICSLQEGEDLRRIELVRRLARESCQFLQVGKKVPEVPAQQNDEVPTLQVKEVDQDVLVLRKVPSESPAPTAGSADSDWRYVVVSGTPEKILEHLLNDLHQVEGQGKETDSLLDDFLLTYTVFMSTGDLCQALLRHYCAKRYEDKEDEADTLYRKQKVLHLVLQWTALYRDWLREDEHTKLFLKTLYRYVLDDLYEYPSLEKELREFQKLLRMHRRHTLDEYSPHRKNKALFHQFSLRENWLQQRGTVNEVEEVFCRVYITEHSYLSVKAKVSASAQEILKTVAEKLQYLEEDLVLVAVEFSGEKHVLQPDDCFIPKSLEVSSRTFVCRQDLTDVLNPFADNEDSQHRTIKMLGMNTWDLALGLTNFDWALFNAIHEQELIYYIFSSQGDGGKTANLNLLLQRCNEVQLWVATEILLCSQLCKRVQLVKKFIKVAAHCKAQRNLNSFFAIIMGLNTAAVGRLSQTWEKIPGKFRKLFSELESLTDPSLNHKAYRDAFKKMKPPKIPFVPLLIKDVTFIHEGNKTFLDNLVNFEKLHMIADTVRLIRHCRNDQIGNEGTPKDHQDVKIYVHHLHIIDSQQILFELSHRLEPRV